MNDWRVVCGDSLAVLRGMPERSVNCCVTSPPYYGLRDYDADGQIGQESTVDAYVAKLVDVLGEVRRVLRDDGTLWLNLGDSYAGSYGAQGREGGAKVSDMSAHQVVAQGRKMARTGALDKTPRCKPKDLIGVPWMLAFALRSAGWWLRQDIIWAKPNPMPESVRDRCTKSHEYVFLLSKSERYHYDAKAIAEPVARASVARLAQDVALQRGSLRVPGKTNGAMKAVGGPQVRNARSVWRIATTPSSLPHFAMMPMELARRCVVAGCPVGGVVLDPFAGTGTTGLAALESGRRFVGVELNPKTAAIANDRLAAMARETAQGDLFAEVAG